MRCPNSAKCPVVIKKVGQSPRPPSSGLASMGDNQLCRAIPLSAGEKHVRTFMYETTLYVHVCTYTYCVHVHMYACTCVCDLTVNSLKGDGIWFIGCSQVLYLYLLLCVCVCASAEQSMNVIKQHSPTKKLPPSMQHACTLISRVLGCGLQSVENTFSRLPESPTYYMTHAVSALTLAAHALLWVDTGTHMCTVFTRLMESLARFIAGPGGAFGILSALSLPSLQIQVSHWLLVACDSHVTVT